MQPARSPSIVWALDVPEAARPFFCEALQDPTYQSLCTFREQCAFLAGLDPAVSTYAIGRFFGVNAKTVWTQIAKHTTPRKSHGRPPLLSAEQSADVEAFIQARCNDHDPATVCDLQNFIWENFQLSVLPDTLRKWVNRTTQFKTARSQPMEDRRLQTRTQDIESYLSELAEAVDGIPSALVLNLDESGFQRFVDSKHETVIVPRDVTRAFHPVSRQEKRATFLLTVAADGSALKPLVLVPRVTIEGELILAGYGPQSCILAHTANGYITRELFERYIRQVLVPYVVEMRQLLGYDGHAVLTMDQCSCHCSDTINEICAANGIRLIYLPAHTSDQTQPCDLGLFGNMKAAQARIHVPEGMSLQSRQIVRIISAFRATCHPCAVTSAFRRAGISNVLRNGRAYAKVTPGTCSAVREPPVEWSEQVPPNPFDKSRVSIREGLWTLGTSVQGTAVQGTVVQGSSGQGSSGQIQVSRVEAPIRDGRDVTVMTAENTVRLEIDTR